MSEPRYCDMKGQFCYCHDYGRRCEYLPYEEDEDESTPFSRSRAALPENIRKTLEASNLPIDVATAIADLCEEKLTKAGTNGESPVYGFKSVPLPKSPSVSVSAKDKSYIVFHRGLVYVFERDDSTTAAKERT